MNRDDIQNDYNRISEDCDQFARELARQLEELLCQKNISLGFPLQYRVKSMASILEKIERGAIHVEDLRGVTDLIGLRIILLFKRDVETVRNLLQKSLRVFSEEDTHARLGDREFGYGSVHMDIGLKPSWAKMPTFRNAGNLRAEIQIRTVAQHIWASASHLLQYKREAAVPPPVRRAIHRVSALLETVDLEFERVLEQRAEYSSDIKDKSGAELLNVDLLAKVLSESLPQKNRDEAENYADLLDDLLVFEIRSAQQLRALLLEQREHLHVAEEERLREEREMDEPIGVSRERLNSGVFFTHVGLAREALSGRYGRKWREYQKRKHGLASD